MQDGIDGGGRGLGTTAGKEGSRGVGGKEGEQKSLPTDWVKENQSKNRVEKKS